MQNNYKVRKKLPKPTDEQREYLLAFLTHYAESFDESAKVIEHAPEEVQKVQMGQYAYYMQAGKFLAHAIHIGMTIGRPKPAEEKKRMVEAMIANGHIKIPPKEAKAALKKVAARKK